MVLLYDGSFDGLMTAVYEAYYSSKTVDQIVAEHDYQKNFMESCVMIYHDYEKAKKVTQAILNQLGKGVFEYVLYAFYSEDQSAGTAIYHFLKLAFKKGSSVIQYRTHAWVEPVWNMYRKVARESHRMLGLIRFIETADRLLVSQFETDYFLLPILASHFFNRLTGEKWMLHDIRRGLAAICDGHQWEIIELDATDQITKSSEEKLIKEVWQTYYRHIAIQERKNPKLQMQMMPKKYWKYLIEKVE